MVGRVPWRVKRDEVDAADTDGISVTQLGPAGDVRVVALAQLLGQGQVVGM
jgi:hypothetical protein